MRAFTIIALLIVLLIAVYIVGRDMRSRLSENEGQPKMTAVEKAKEAETNVERSNKAIQKKLQEIQKNTGEGPAVRP